MAATVAVKEDDGFATALGGVEECGAVHYGGVGVALVGAAACGQNQDGEYGWNCFLDVFHIISVSCLLFGRGRIPSAGHTCASEGFGTKTPRWWYQMATRWDLVRKYPVGGTKVFTSFPA